MKRLFLFVALSFVSFFVYAENKLYSFYDAFSISVSEKLEMRQGNDAFTRFLNDTLNYVSNVGVVFQQRNLSKKQSGALEHYCRILIAFEQDETCPYPSSDDMSFSSNELKELAATAEQELMIGQYFVEPPTTSIERTKLGYVYVRVHYIRTGFNGNVDVCICYFYNYDCVVKAIFSYRESEAHLWKDVLHDALNSFTWNNPYTSSEYTSDDICDSPVSNTTKQSNSDRLKVIMAVIISVCFILFCVVRLIKKTVAEKDLNVTSNMDTIQPQPIHEQPQQVNLDEDEKSVPTVVSSELLLTFARFNGKMQVVNREIAEDEYERYCQFTSPDGGVIRVEFSDRVGFLSPQEISKKKYQLCINKTSDGKYILDFVEDEQIEDILLF